MQRQRDRLKKPISRRDAIKNIALSFGVMTTIPKGALNFSKNDRALDDDGDTMARMYFSYYSSIYYSYNNYSSMEIIQVTQVIQAIRTRF